MTGRPGGSGGPGRRGGGVEVLVAHRGHPADGEMDPGLVEPVNVAGGLSFHLGRPRPAGGPFVFDELGLVQPDGGLLQGVVQGVADGADGGRDPGFDERFAEGDRGVPGCEPASELNGIRVSSDRGCQYTSRDFRQLATDHGVVLSLGRKATSLLAG